MVGVERRGDEFVIYVCNNRKGNAGACVAKVDELERTFVSKKQQHPLGRHETYLILSNTSKPIQCQNVPRGRRPWQGHGPDRSR